MKIRKYEVQTEKDKADQKADNFATYVILILVFIACIYCFFTISKPLAFIIAIWFGFCGFYFGIDNTDYNQIIEVPDDTVQHKQKT